MRLFWRSVRSITQTIFILLGITWVFKYYDSQWISAETVKYFVGAVLLFTGLDWRYVERHK